VQQLKGDKEGIEPWFRSLYPRVEDHVAIVGKRKRISPFLSAVDPRAVHPVARLSID
jgi:hypothetical protein